MKKGYRSRAWLNMHGSGWAGGSNDVDEKSCMQSMSALERVVCPTSRHYAVLVLQYMCATS